MVKHWMVAVAVLSGVILCSAPAQAQSVTQLGQRHGLGSPTVSPYLNLQAIDQFGIQGGYQTLVKPFIDQRRAINSNASDLTRLQNQVSRGSGGRGGGGGGGGGGFFMNYSHYYPGMK